MESERHATHARSLGAYLDHPKRKENDCFAVYIRCRILFSVAGGAAAGAG